MRVESNAERPAEYLFDYREAPNIALYALYAASARIRRQRRLQSTSDTVLAAIDQVLDEKVGSNLDAPIPPSEPKRSELHDDETESPFRLRANLGNVAARAASIETDAASKAQTT